MSPENTPTQPAAYTRRGEFWEGAKATFPLVVGAIPFGIIFGALAVTSGLSPGAASAMSAIVFAGSAQFIAAGLVASGVSTLIIVLTTFVVNLRHALYSATLAPHMKHLPQRWLVPLGFFLTDETFVVMARRFQQKDDSPYHHWFYLGWLLESLSEIYRIGPSLVCRRAAGLQPGISPLARIDP